MYPTCWRTASERRSPRSPASSTSPTVGGSSPQSILMVVVLPAPLAPSSPYTSPGRTARFTSFTASNAPKLRPSPRAAMATASGDDRSRRAPGKGGTCRSPSSDWRIDTNAFSRVGGPDRTESSRRSAAAIAPRTPRSPAATSGTITSRRSPKRWTSVMPSWPESTASTSGRSGARTSRRDSPSPSRTSAGVPILRMRPSCMSATRWQRSASSR